MSSPRCECAWEALRGDPLPWLLDATRPNLHWRVLVELVGRPTDSGAVRRAQGGASAAEPVATLLENLQPDGSWTTSAPRWRRYDGPGWRFVAAVTWGADPADPRLDAAARSILRDAPGDGGFSQGDDDRPSSWVTARLVAALTELGFGSHLRVQEALAWFEDDPKAWSVQPAEARGVAAALLPATARSTPRRVGLVQRLVDEIEHTFRDDPGSLDRLGFPDLYRTDAAEMLWALARGGVPYASWMQRPLIRLQRLQDEGGRWSRSHPRPRSLPIPASCRSQPGQACRWLTLRVVVALYAYAVEAALPRLFPQKP